MKKLLSAVTSAVMAGSAITSAFASLPVSAAGSLSVSQPNFSMGEVLDVSANKTASDGSVEWLIPTVTAAPGQTVTLPVVAKNSSLAVAGAQFNVDAASPIKYKSVTGGDAYTSSIGDNGKGTKFLFDDNKGIEKVAAEGATVFTIAYTIPADCKEGTYDVKWANASVSDTDGYDITSKVKFTDGAIKVVKDNGEGKIDWVLDKVTGYPGETVTVKAYVNNKDNVAVAVAGAQYKIDAESPIKYKSFKSGGAYVTDIGNNESKTSFLFHQTAGLGVVAANNATIMTLTYTIPEDCKPGEYPVTWSKKFVSDTDGFDLTSRVNFVDGMITVKNGEPEDGQVAWILDNVKANPGEQVKVKAVVSDTKSSALAVAGAQFKVKTDSDNIKYNSFTAGTAYPSDMSANETKSSFMFRTNSGKAVSAANGSTILTITYDIPANCPAGVYPVSWADGFVSDTDGYDLTKNVIFKDGSITVGDVNTDGSVKWVIPNVVGEKGKEVTLQVKVDGKGDLPVAGAQFEITNEAATPFKSADGKPYGETLRSNDKQKFEFFTGSGNGKTAKAGDNLFALTFTVPEDIADGVYPVKWAKQFVSDKDGFDITKNVEFKDGAIYINTPIPVETTTTTTTTTNPTVTTTTTTVVPAPKGGIAWQIGSTQAERGQTVTLDITVVDTENSKLAIGGAQFVIENDNGVNYSTIKGSDAYKSELSTNDAIKKSLFKSENGKGIAASNGNVVATLTFKVPTDCALGKYYVNFADGTLKVFDEDGFDLSKLVEGRKGYIEVVDHITTTLAPNQSTSTTTSTTKAGTEPVSTKSTESTAPISTESTKSTSSVS
ncbi:cohesin domain-containing protein, partial [Ruminococcus flavefaciens]